MKIGLYGGAFDPITNGHVNAIKKLSKYFNKIWVMPCYKSMTGKRMVNPNHRLEMCKLSISDIEGAEVFDYEIRNKLELSSSRILELIEKEYEEDDFYFIIGMDLANSITTWKNYKYLLNRYKFCVIPRKSFISTSNWYNQNNHHLFYDIPTLDISSTKWKEVREDRLLDKTVINYIKEKRLY